MAAALPAVPADEMPCPRVGHQPFVSGGYRASPVFAPSSQRRFAAAVPAGLPSCCQHSHSALKPAILCAATPGPCQAAPPQGLAPLLHCLCGRHLGRHPAAPHLFPSSAAAAPCWQGSCYATAAPCVLLLPRSCRSLGLLLPPPPPCWAMLPTRRALGWFNQVGPPLTHGYQVFCLAPLSTPPYLVPTMMCYLICLLEAPCRCTHQAFFRPALYEGPRKPGALAAPTAPLQQRRRARFAAALSHRPTIMPTPLFRQPTTTQACAGSSLPLASLWALASLLWRAQSAPRQNPTADRSRRARPGSEPPSLPRNGALSQGRRVRGRCRGAGRPDDRHPLSDRATHPKAGTLLRVTHPKAGPLS